MRIFVSAPLALEAFCPMIARYNTSRQSVQILVMGKVSTLVAEVPQRAGSNALWRSSEAQGTTALHDAASCLDQPLSAGM